MDVDIGSRDTDTTTRSRLTCNGNIRFGAFQPLFQGDCATYFEKNGSRGIVSCAQCPAEGSFDGLFGW